MDNNSYSESENNDTFYLDDINAKFSHGFVSANDTRYITFERLFKPLELYPVKIRLPYNVTHKNFVYHDPRNYDHLWVDNYRLTSLDRPIKVVNNCFEDVRTITQWIEADKIKTGQYFTKNKRQYILITTTVQQITHSFCTYFNTIKPEFLNDDFLNDFNKINNLQSAMNFINKFGFRYPLRIFKAGPVDTVEWLLSSNKRSQDELLNLGLEVINGSEFPYHDEEKILGKLSKIKDFDCAKTTLEGRYFGVSEGNKDDFYNMRIFEYYGDQELQYKLIFEFFLDFAKTHPQLLTNKSGLNFLRLATLERDPDGLYAERISEVSARLGQMGHVELKNDKWPFKYVDYFNEVISTQVAKLCTLFTENPEAPLNETYDVAENTNETNKGTYNIPVYNVNDVRKTYTKEDPNDPTYYVETKNVDDLVRKSPKDNSFERQMFYNSLFRSNIPYINMYFYKPRCYFLAGCQDLSEFLEDNRDRNNLLIFHDQELITNVTEEFGEEKAFFELIVEALNKETSACLQDGTNFVFVDYGLHECDLLGKNGHILYRMKWFPIATDEKRKQGCIHLIMIESDEIKTLICAKNPETFLKRTYLKMSSLGMSAVCLLDRFKDLCDLKELKTLDLSRNWILGLDKHNFEVNVIDENEDSGEAEKLGKKIYTKDCPETDIYCNKVENLDNLEVLNVSRNLILKITAHTFDQMTNLTILKLNSNRISEIQTDLFHSLTNLQFLDLSNNKIKTLVDLQFSSLANLVTLRLTSNLLEEISDDIFVNCPKLEFLHLDKNCLTSIDPHIFRGNTLLKRLYLNSNKLMTIPAKIESLDRLEVLDLSFNRIQTLPINAFHDLKSLKQLCLQNNYICQLESGHFQDLDRLRVLLVHSNKIGFCPAETFNGLVSLKVLTLFENQLIKETNYQAFKKTLKRLKYFYYKQNDTKFYYMRVVEKIKKYYIV